MIENYCVLKRDDEGSGQTGLLVYRDPRGRMDKTQ